MAPANSFSCRAHLQAARQGPDVAEHEVRDPVVLHRVVEGGPDRHALGVQQRGRELQLLLEAGADARPMIRTGRLLAALFVLWEWI